ncbi:MAG: hypothetical protein E7474_03890 [Ruminococcaceae bacterium]|nr:hypothetical protein [Oscillospiraceae bacterium]
MLPRRFSFVKPFCEIFRINFLRAAILPFEQNAGKEVCTVKNNQNNNQNNQNRNNTQNEQKQDNKNQQKQDNR